MSAINKSMAAIAIVTNSAAVLSPPLVTLLTVDAETYGYFSLMYIVYSLGCTLIMSVVSDAAGRSSDSALILGSRHVYVPPVTQVSLIVGIVALILALSIPELRASSISAAVAIGSSTYRLGARYQEVYLGRYATAFYADLAMIVGLAVGWVLFGAFLDGPSSLVAFSSWALGGSLSMLVGSRPILGSVTCLLNWHRTHKAEIKPLLGEALFTEVTAVVGPLVLIPMLSVANFGVYRATFNVAAPMRAMFSAVRPNVATKRIDELSSPRMLAVLAVGGGLSGLLAYLGLRLIDVMGWFGGAIQELSSFAVPVALYVVSSVIYTFWYYVARMHAPAKRLLIARVLQSALLVACPALGAWLFGLEGAIWGVFVAMLISGIVWAAAPVRHSAKLVGVE